MIRAKRQLQIRIGLAIPDLAATSRLSAVPIDTLAGRVLGLERHGSASKPVAEDIAHVVPDLIGVEIVGEDGLADVRFEDAAFDGGHLEGNSTGLGIFVEGFAVGLVFGNDFLVGDAAADRPEVDGSIALVGHDGAADGLGASDEGDESESVEEHL